MNKLIVVNMFRLNPSSDILAGRIFKISSIRDGSHIHNYENEVVHFLGQLKLVMRYNK